MTLSGDEVVNIANEEKKLQTPADINLYARKI
jgi:hypothetical protein